MHVSGTATSYLDLLDKFITFVTTGLSAGQNWTKLSDATPDPVNPGYDRVCYLKAPGLAGTDEIFVCVVGYHNQTSDTYNIGLYGLTGYSPLLTISNQPGAGPACGSWLLCWNTNIPYWFIANGRSAKVVAKIGPIYEHAYAGFIVPYATPAEYPYPLLIGGSSSNGNQRYSAVENNHSAYWNPGTYSYSIGDFTSGQSSGCFLRTPGGFWAAAGNEGQYNNQLSNGLKLWPYAEFENIGRVWGSMTDYTLMPIVLHNNQVSPAVYGELDGVYFVSGYAQASENIITVDSIDYLVVQNTYHTSGPSATAGASPGTPSNHYAAIALTTD